MFASEATIIDSAHQVLTLTHLFLSIGHQFLTPVGIMTMFQGILAIF